MVGPTATMTSGTGIGSATGTALSCRASRTSVDGGHRQLPVTAASPAVSRCAYSLAAGGELAVMRFDHALARGAGNPIHHSSAVTPSSCELATALGVPMPGSAPAAARRVTARPVKRRSPICARQC